MEMITVEKDILKDLVSDSLRYRALVEGGVDNWEWYSESLSNFLQNIGYNDFEEFADICIEDYKKEVM